MDSQVKPVRGQLRGARRAPARSPGGRRRRPGPSRPRARGPTRARPAASSASSAAAGARWRPGCRRRARRSCSWSPVPAVPVATTTSSGQTRPAHGPGPVGDQQVVGLAVEHRDDRLGDRVVRGDEHRVGVGDLADRGVERTPGHEDGLAEQPVGQQAGPPVGERHDAVADVALGHGVRRPGGRARCSRRQGRGPQQVGDGGVRRGGPVAQRAGHLAGQEPGAAGAR